MTKVQITKLPRLYKSIIGAVITFILLEFLFYRVWSFLGFSIITLAAFIILYGWIEKGSILTKTSLIKIILPLLLLISTLAFSFFEANRLFVQLIIIVSSFSAYLFFSRVKFPLKKEDSVRVTYYWLDVITLLTAFLCYLTIWNLLFIRDFPIWSLMIMVTVVSYLIFFYVLWARSKGGRVLPLFSSLFALIVLEAFVILSFWNVDPVPKSLLMVIVLYFYLGVLDLKLRGQLTGRKIIEYLLISIVASLLVVIMVRW